MDHRGYEAGNVPASEPNPPAAVTDWDQAKYDAAVAKGMPRLPGDIDDPEFGLELRQESRWLRGVQVEIVVRVRSRVDLADAAEQVKLLAVRTFAALEAEGIDE